ncbi:MAG: ribonuclease E inhibitor RraB [Candidatus Nomurabacteria bacterium]|nr:ribonuclease E inhibitor RraB [Candidatus Nomurabacteria bacterium]
MFNFFKKQKIQDKDQAVLNQLIKYGSNLSKLHSIDFFLYFSNKEAAERGKVMIQERFANSSVSVSDSQKQKFLCLVNISMVPNLETIQNASTQFEAITASLGGEYDGWETAIER